MKIFIKTYGCQANISDSEKIRGILNNKRYTITDNESSADIIIVNSCSVKNKTQSKELYYIEQKLIQGKKVFVGGCLTKTIDLKKRFSNYKNLKAVFDTNSIDKICQIIKSPKDTFSDKKINKLKLPLIRINKNIAIITISEGCLNNCTYCATKQSRGILKSYEIGEIKKSLKKAVEDGCKIIYLTSQDNGCYGFDIKTDLSELLNELIKVSGDFKIRVGMINPLYLKKILFKLIESYKSPKITKFLHIPIQSGSNFVLKHMKRGYTSEDFIKIVYEFRKAFPEISISTDVIVGYPTETKNDFQKTLKLIKKTKPEIVNISKFSSRPKTKAHELKQLSSEIIKKISRFD